jgi:hypothetical protein
MAVGLFAGAVIGRTLPALIVAAALSVGLVVSLGVAKAAAVRSTYDQTNVGGPGSVSQFLASNPNIDVRFVSPSGEVSTLEQALAAVPTGTLDPGGWLQERHRLVPLGVKPGITVTWQVIETLALGALGVVLLGATIAVVE